MRIQFIPDNFDINKYNDVVYHPLQTWEWGEARFKMGIKVFRIGIFNNEHLEQVFQMTLHPIPFSSYTVGYIPRSVWPSNQVLQFIKEQKQLSNIIFIKFEPDIIKGAENKNITSSFVSSPHPLFPEWTMNLDLTKSEDEILATMKQKTRYNIKLAQKKGVVVREESTDKGFEIFSKLYFDTCRRQKYHGHTLQYHTTIWKTISSNRQQATDNRLSSHILTAYYEDKPLASFELFKFKDKFYYPYGGTSIENRQVMAPNLLMWEAIRLGKQLGATTFDLWGSLQPGYDQNHPWAGFTRFKEGYGAEFVQKMGSYDLILKPVQYSLYNTLYKIRTSLI